MPDLPFLSAGLSNQVYSNTSVTVFVYLYAGEWRGVHSLSLSHTACSENNYKSTVGNTDMCVLCPTNSNAPAASNSCQCMTGYRRENVMDITSGCTGTWAVFGPVMLREVVACLDLPTPTKSVYHDLHAMWQMYLRAQHYWCCNQLCWHLSCYTELWLGDFVLLMPQEQQVVSRALLNPWNLAMV